MRIYRTAFIALAAALAIAPAANAGTVIYQATSNDHGNGLNFGPDGTSNAPGTGYWEMGNTVSFAGSASSYQLASADVTLYGGEFTNYPIQMDIYSGSNPNTGTLLGTETAPAGYATNTTVFSFSGLTVPDTITYILSLPDQTGSYDSIFLYPILTSGAAPTIGSGPNSLWYGAPGSFVANNTYAVADGATTNYLQTEFTAATVTPEPNSLLLLGTGLIGLAFVAFRKSRSAHRSGLSLGAL